MSTSALSRSAKGLAGTVATPLALVATCIVIDVLLGQLVQKVLHWPIYLDSVGTILAGVLGGPLIGLITGVAANLIWGVVFSDPTIVPYAITAACIGVAAGLAARFQAFRTPQGVAIAGILTGVMAALVSAPISAYLVPGRTSGSAEVIQRLHQTGASLIKAATLQGLLSDPVDKLLSFLIVWLIIFVLPASLKGSCARSEAALGRLRFNSRYGVAAVLSAAAAGFSWFFLPAFGPGVYSVFYLAVILSAWNGGLGPAMLATAVGVGAQIGFQFGFQDSLHGAAAIVSDALRLVILVLVSGFIAFVNLRREAALGEQRRRQAELRSVVDSIVEALVLISPEDRVLRVNHRFQEIFSVAPLELVGHGLDALDSVLERAFHDSAAVQQEIRRTKDNEQDRFTDIYTQVWPRERQLEVFSAPVTSDGRFLGRLFGFRDVTGEREPDRTETEFVSRASQKPRTPFTSIQGSPDLLWDEDAGGLDEQHQQ